ncbi:hypothetical protein Hanom_Chr04g00324571 [Helianthus anomalus]
MNPGIKPVRFLLLSCRETTELWRQWTSGHMHGDVVEFQFVKDGGFPHVFLRLSKVVCSEVENVCDVTVVVRRRMTEIRWRCGGGGGDVIFRWWVGLMGEHVVVVCVLVGFEILVVINYNAVGFIWYGWIKGVVKEGGYLLTSLVM